MECIEDSFCYSFLPELPPPPPLPYFLSEDVENFLNQTGGSRCDLCSWAGAEVGENSAAEDNSALPISSLLVIVAVVSALVGAGLTASFLSFRRLRNRKFEGGSGSVRHLSRKINESSRPTPSSSSFTSTALTENTYCEGPYNDKDVSNNIYAELHPGIQSGVWIGRPRPPIPPPQNCYLELKDLPNRSCGRCLPVPPSSQWQSTPEDSSSIRSAYYSDLELGRIRSSAQPV